MTAARFQRWLNYTHQARKEANAAAAFEQACITQGMGEAQASIHTSAATRPIQGGDCTPYQNTPGGDHAEVNAGNVQGQAVGAGRPHCGNCTNYIMENGGATASPIRGPNQPDGWDPTAGGKDWPSGNPDGRRW
jgi:hypothetical protein